MSLMHHHYSEGPMQSSIHFNYLTHMDQLKEKQEKFYAAKTRTPLSKLLKLHF